MVMPASFRAHVAPALYSDKLPSQHYGREDVSRHIPHDKLFAALVRQGVAQC